jgi:hypothetical protein
MQGELEPPVSANAHGREIPVESAALSGGGNVIEGVAILPASHAPRGDRSENGGEDLRGPPLPDFTVGI